MITLVESRTIARKHNFSSLITKPNANAKLMKSIGYYNAGISLAQASLSGYNMCSESTPKCRLSCLGGTGRAEFTPTITQVRINRTKLFVEDRPLFWKILEPQLHEIDRAAKRLEVPVAFRPNVLSDQPFHKLLPQMFDIFSHWNFYSYTKIRNKVRDYIDGKLPSNYHVTYSYNEKVKMDYIKGIIADGVNVAVPFYDKETLKPTIPNEWEGITVVNGDKSDLRFLDPQYVFIGLSVKLPKNKVKARKKIEQADGFFIGV